MRMLFSRNQEERTQPIKDALTHYAETVRAIEIQIEASKAQHARRVDPAKLDEMIEDGIKAERAEREEILKLLSPLKNPNQHAVLRLRYCFCMDWKEIAAVLCDDVESVDQVEDHHIKRCIALHRRAVERLYTESMGEAQ